MTDPRTVDAEGLVNARDLGGLPLRRSGVTPSGVFVRSESPDLVTTAGWTALHDHGIRSLVDLREHAERDEGERPGWLRTRHVDLDGRAEHPGFWADYWDEGLAGTPLWYLPHLAAQPERIGAVLVSIADAPAGGVLVHCAGGRDRTGLVAAVLLSIVGVEPDAIVDDSLETVRNAPAMAAARGGPDRETATEALLVRRGTTSARAFRAFLDGLDVDALLASLPPEQAESLRTWRGALPVR